MDTWSRKYDIAKKYREEYGNLLVPDKFHYSGINLGNWIYLQRKNYKDGKLADKRKTQLERIGMVWNALPDYDNMWHESFDNAREFKEEFNTLVVPHGYIYKGRGLGRWISHQRELYKKHKLSLDKVEKLESIGMVWDASNNNIATSFPEQAIFFYIRRYFDDAINRFKDLGFELDIFIPEINTAIEYDGFLWHKDNRKDIEKNAKCMKQNIRLIRVREKGLEDLPPNSSVVTFSINRGYSNLENVIQRLLDYLGVKQKADINLSRDRNDIISNYINVYNDYWDKMYRLAKAYYDKNKTLVGIEDKFLSGWVGRQRSKYNGRKAPLTNSQIEKLESIGMKWDVYKDQWEETYLLAKRYYDEHGDLNIKGSYELSGVKLGSWIQAQRGLYKAGKLSKKRVNKLNAIDMTWDPLMDSWNH